MISPEKIRPYRRNLGVIVLISCTGSRRATSLTAAATIEQIRNTDFPKENIHVQKHVYLTISYTKNPKMNLL